MPDVGPLDIVICGLSITSSWGNGHATTYRALVRRLAERGHRVTFLERDVPWYAESRDLPDPPYCRTFIYGGVEELQDVHGATVRQADAVIVGSYVPDGIAIGRWVTAIAEGITAFYDIDTPVTLKRLERDDCDYLNVPLIGRYHMYLSFAGGPLLRTIEGVLGSPKARPLYCSVEPEAYRPLSGVAERWDLGYLGTYSDDRQPTLERTLLEPARAWPEGRFVVVGPQYPAELQWPANVQRIEHLPPSEHCEFYNAQRFALNVTRADMIRAGWCPSVRIFEAAACGTPIVSDHWPGMADFLTPGKEVFLVERADQVVGLLRSLPEEERGRVAERARKRILDRHSAARRAAELEAYLLETMEDRTPRRAAAAGGVARGGSTRAAGVRART